MEKNGFFDEYWDIDGKMKEMDRIDDIIEERSQENQFCIPDDFDPAIDGEEEKKLTQRCETMWHELGCRGFCVELDKNAPLKAIYLYLKYIALITEGLKLPDKHNIVFNGCTAWCEDCFQKSWCDVKKDIDEEDANLEEKC